MTDQQLDFESDRREWSILFQLSHMASLIYRWLIIRWGETLFPNGSHGVEDVEGLAEATDRRMDKEHYWELPVKMAKVEEGIDLAQRVLAERSVGFLRNTTVLRDDPGSAEAGLIRSAHKTGVTLTADGGTIWTVEATMRHIYFEETTHLYNIQRLKRAQGLPTVVDVPKVGYWKVEGWDTSEP